MVIKAVLLSLLIASLTATSVQNFLLDPDTKYISDRQIKEPQNGDEIPVERFFVIGDFGDVENSEHLDFMTNVMDQLAGEEEFSFITTVGDNVYPSGIEDIKDLKVADEIMSYFQKPNLKDLKMYPTLGNHDCYIDYSNEIKYSQFNDQWEMPSDYYELRRPLKDDPSKSMVILMSNSCLLTCYNLEEKDKKRRKK